MISNNEEEFKYKSSVHASGQKDFILYHLIKGFTLKEILFALPDKLSLLLQCLNKFQNIQPNNNNFQEDVMLLYNDSFQDKRNYLEAK